MKIKTLIASVLAIAALAVSCQPQEEKAPEKASLKFSTDVVAIPFSGGNETVRITANNDWDAVVGADADWISIDRQHGSSGSQDITLNVAGHNGHSSRMGGVFITSAGLKEQIVVAQAPAPNYDKITIDPASLDFEYEAASKTVSLTANVDWTASCEGSWFAIDVKEGKASDNAVAINVSVQKNDTKSSREGKVVFEGGDAKKVELSIFQEAFESIVLSEKTLSFSCATGQQMVSVDANVDWTATSSASWLTVSPASGTKGSVTGITVTAGENSATTQRSATITFKGGTQAEETLTVTQEGHEMKSMTLGTWSCKDASHTDTHSPDWSTNGANAYSKGNGLGIALPEEEGSSAFMKFESGGFTYTSSKPLTFITAAEGHLAAKPMWTNDSFVFHFPGVTLAKGGKVRWQGGVRCVAKAPRYWKIECSIDGGATWKMADNQGKTYNDGTANIEISAENKVFDVDATCTLDGPISGELLVRLFCVDGKKLVDGKTGTSPTAGSTIRLTPSIDGSIIGPTISYEN